MLLIHPKQLVEEIEDYCLKNGIHLFTYPDYIYALHRLRNFEKQAIKLKYLYIQRQEGISYEQEIQAQK